MMFDFIFFFQVIVLDEIIIGNYYWKLLFQTKNTKNGIR